MATKELIQPRNGVAIVGITQIQGRETVLFGLSGTVIVVIGTNNGTTHQRNIFLNLGGGQETGVNDHAVQPLVVGSDPHNG